MKRRIDGMRRDSQAFVAEVNRICRERYPSAADLPVVDAATRLVRAHERARQDDAERARLGVEQRRLAEARNELERAEREADERVRALLAAGRAWVLRRPRSRGAEVRDGARPVLGA